MAMLCPHTRETLQPLPGSDGRFLVAPSSGVVYAVEPQALDYSDLYFTDDYRAQYGKSYVEDEPNLRRLARSRLALPPVAKAAAKPLQLLEIGAACGFFLDEARQAGFEVRGIEPSAYAADYAYSQLSLNIEQRRFVADDEGRGKEEGVYSVVAAFYTLEHFAEQRELFAAVARLLLPGGLFLFALPSTNGPLFRQRRRDWCDSHPSDHYADYSPQSLAQILPLYGMRLIAARPASYHPQRDQSLWGRSLQRLGWGGDSIWRLAAHIAAYGDTFEGVARRV